MRGTTTELSEVEFCIHAALSLSLSMLPCSGVSGDLSVLIVTLDKLMMLRKGEA